jgi:hypothetical protein
VVGESLPLTACVHELGEPADTDLAAAVMFVVGNESIVRDDSGPLRRPQQLAGERIVAVVVDGLDVPQCRKASSSARFPSPLRPASAVAPFLRLQAASWFCVPLLPLAGAAPCSRPPVAVSIGHFRRQSPTSSAGPSPVESAAVELSLAVSPVSLRD